MTLKLVIFDCDGTILDSQHSIVAAMAHAFSEVGLVPPDRQAVLSVVGLSLPQAVERLLPGHDTALVHRISDTYKSCFREIRHQNDHREPLYPGMREAIAALARRDDVVLGIATGKSRRGVRDLLEREGWTHLFPTIQTADTNPSKPHPAMILTAMAEAGTEPMRTIMIGDTTFDIEMARAAEVHALGVSWGYHPVASLTRAGAHLLADTCEALPALVSQLLDRPEGT